MIGCVAFEGTITTLAVVLFSVQFIWQFPHFWAIGVLSFDEYKKAGFRIMPETNGVLNPQLGLHTLIYTVLLLPVCLLSFYSGLTNEWMTLAILITTGVFVHFAWQFYRAFDRSSARALMFSSFVYLPVMFLIIYLGIII
jgi:protoheme IX farnesyltransferase